MGEEQAYKIKLKLYKRPTSKKVGFFYNYFYWSNKKDCLERLKNYITKY
jgi:hypothetical protein